MKLRVAISLVCLLAWPAFCFAEEEGKAGPPKVAYVSLTPPFVGNYALDGGPKLRIFKADVALRVTGAESEALVKRHDALIRNQLVALFTQQTDLSTADAKEKLRVEALKQVQQVLNDEEGKPVVEDLLFNNLIIQ